MRKEYFSKCSLKFTDGEEYWFTLRMPAYHHDEDNLEEYCSDLCEQIEAGISNAYAQKYGIDITKEEE